MSTCITEQFDPNFLAERFDEEVGEDLPETAEAYVTLRHPEKGLSLWITGPEGEVVSTLITWEDFGERAQKAREFFLWVYSDSEAARALNNTAQDLLRYESEHGETSREILAELSKALKKRKAELGVEGQNLGVTRLIGRGPERADEHLQASIEHHRKLS